LIQDEFGVGIFTEVVHLVEYLDVVHRLVLVWFEIFEKLKLKVGTRE
jgi:hypothetical protein